MSWLHITSPPRGKGRKGQRGKKPTETEYVIDVWARLNKVVGRNPYTEIWPDRNNKVHGP